jgi:aminoglycoside phosphotransferase (APT) family kinase protein
MMEPGLLLAAGRDADIYEYGPGLVLRRSRAGRSLTDEARVMEFVRSQGYPVPAVAEMSDDGVDMVMERIEGVDMVAAMSKRPWTIPRQGAVLADLHRQLHELSAPDWLHDAPVGRGDRLLHLDLHPLNVMIGPRGPVVIDWTGACRGDPAVDVALAWVLIAAGEVPTGRLLLTILGHARSVLLKRFLRPFDVDVVKQSLSDVVAWKTLDPHMSVSEQDRMWQVVREVVGVIPS